MKHIPFYIPHDFQSLTSAYHNYADTIWSSVNTSNSRRTEFLCIYIYVQELGCEMDTTYFCPFQKIHIFI